MTSLRVWTANIQSGKSARGQPTTEPELAAAFDGIEADVVALQEVDRYQARSGGLDQVAIIAGALGLDHYRYAAALTGDLAGVRELADPIGNHPGPAYGVGLVSRFPVIAWFATRLPQVVHRLPAWRGSRPAWWVHEPRVAVAAVIDGPDGPFTVASTHLSLLPAVARWQLRTLLHAATGLSERVIVAGDFNLPEATVAKVAAGWDRPRALTFHADYPVRQIDHVLVRAGRAHGPQAHRLAISDHRALAVEVRWQ